MCVCVCVCVSARALICGSLNVALKPIVRSHSNSIFKVPYPAFHFFFFLDFYILLKLNVVHIRRNKKKYFLQMILMILIKFSEFTTHSKRNNMTLSDFLGIFHETKKKNVNSFQLLFSILNYIKSSLINKSEVFTLQYWTTNFSSMESFSSPGESFN